MFVSYSSRGYLLPGDSAGQAVMVIAAAVALMVLLAMRRLNTGFMVDSSNCMSEGTSTTLRGIAVILLVLGHFCIKCIEGRQVLEYGGEYAVTIFLTLSATGLASRYGLERLDYGFLRKRIRRLIVPVWTTLVIFYSLDYAILGRKHSLGKVVLSFLGVINADPPNGPDWFVSYILFLYLVYWGATRLPISKHARCAAIFLASCLGTVAIVSLRSLDYFKMWPRYAFVFPAAMAVAAYSKTFLDPFRSLLRRKPLVVLPIALALSVLFLRKVGIEALAAHVESAPARQLVESLRYPYLVALVIVAALCLDVWGLKSRVLDFCGKYSFEIYLLHMPFMVYYDFLLFRKPLVVFFSVYMALVVLGAVLLKRWSDLVVRAAS